MPRQFRSPALVVTGFLLLALLTSLLLFWGRGQPRITGRCERVIDGDTFVLSTKSMVTFNQEKIRVRMAFIDAPEKGQRSNDGLPIGEMSKDFLLAECQGQLVEVEAVERDHYGRLVGRVWRGGQDLNLAVLSSGFGLLYPYAKFGSPTEKNQYVNALNFAYRQRRGIWQAQGFLSPYQYRKQNRAPKRQR